MRKIIRKAIAVVLCVVCLVQFSGQAFAAGLFGKTYVKEIILSYGDTDEAARKWLTDNGYEIVNHNLNEGADSLLSRKRAVYLGYKTTKDPEEAITDMKLMNMKGNYSVNDYKLLLEEQKANIRFFIDNFIVAVSEYRENYEKGQSRAIAAHDILNLLYDDDTGLPVGDLLLERIREEYTGEEFAALPADEQAKHADMTTILMQSNSTAVLAIEQVIALATDSSGTLWLERYNGISSYDTMLDELIEEEGITPSKAETELSAKYDIDAKALAAKLADYREFIKTYTESGITLQSSAEEISAFFKDKNDSDMLAWLNAGTQYIIISCISDEDGVSLLELITDEGSDLEGEDRYLLYPLVSVLTEGQRACLDFMPFNQIVSLGINDDAAVRQAMNDLTLGDKDTGSISIYEGVDRTIFGSQVALTNDASNLQQSSEKNAATNWFSDGLSTSTKIIYACLAVSTVAMIGSFILSKYNAELVLDYREWIDLNEYYLEYDYGSFNSDQYWIGRNSIEGARTWANVFRYIGIGMACISFILLGVSLWRTIDELMAYYNVDFSPIPAYIVHQGTDENEEKIFTYYKAVLCNRSEMNMVDDRSEILEDLGDINGDVGKQWVALYTTKDKSAGQPITTDFAVQYENSNIPGERTALSIFGEMSAQNLTNEKNDFTYSDSKKGIYLFYGTDSSAFAGSAITGGTYAIIAGSIIVLAAACIVISRKRSRKRGSVQ